MEFQKDELNEVLNIFQQESTEIIASMDEKLLILEKEGNNPEVGMQLFRDAHSLKGSARMLGFENIQNIAHKIEDIISLVKEEKLVLVPEITDMISESLSFIMDLINKTVEQKEEYTPPEIQEYIEKLESISKHAQDDFEKQGENIEISPEKKALITNFQRIEEIIIDVLYTISNARKIESYEGISPLADEIREFLALVVKVDDDKFSPVKTCATNLLKTFRIFDETQEKKLTFLELNDKVSAFVEEFSKYTDKEHIKKQDYWDVVDNKLNNEPETEIENIISEPPAPIEEYDKFDDIIAKIPLLEINSEFYPELKEFIEHLHSTTKIDAIKNICTNLKEIIDIYMQKNNVLPKDVDLAIKEAMEAIKSSPNSYDEILKRTEVIKTMLTFQQKQTEAPRPAKTVEAKIKQAELTQKDILNTITNTEIKTLRIDSVKLDNLVGQIGELIVSKIKTNEQLSLAKKINNDLVEWQKNFLKMNYYIKYFDKKYLSNPIANLEHPTYDLQKIIAYNRQLCALSDLHQERIAALIKEMNNLFRQLQESEVKLNSTATEIETMVKNMRILPLSTIFQLFPRMVHNIARDKNKKIDLTIEGADLTADKTIIEELKIPLMHIIRNSIDHGIEDVEQRKILGKNPTGKIDITAVLKDNKIVIDVKDDGRGLDIEKIKAKALEKKILTPEELSAITDEELTNLIFYPGFSTEDFVTELSGRGLGLDIVNNKINQLNGRIDIFSQIKKGTVVRITLPATIATKKVFVIEEQRQLWAIETSVIKTIARIDADEIFEKDDKNYYIYDNTAIEIYTLSQILSMENIPKSTEKYTLMIIAADNACFGIIVDKLISDQEIVHKKLAPPLYKVKHISGITTLANGEACLILSVEDIISTLATNKKVKRRIKIATPAAKKDNSDSKILVVDDSQTTRILQRNIITSRGYNVTTAIDPLDALNKAEQTNFDLIVSDVNMPHMDGIEFISKIRQMPDYKNVPVIIVSSEPKERYTDDLNRLNVLIYIQKYSFKQEELLDYIEQALDSVE